MTSIKHRLQLALDLLNERQSAEARTPAWLADQIGMSRPAVRKWFTGEVSQMDPSNLYKAAQVLGVRLHWLITGDGPMRFWEPGREVPQELQRFVGELVGAWESGAIDRVTVARLESVLDSMRR